MVQVTRNFQSEAPLHVHAREVLLDAIDQGWSDPGKLSQSAARARILQGEALESISSHLKVPVDCLEVIGEGNLANHYAISGLLKNEFGFIHSAIDRKDVHAIARTQSHTTQLNVDLNGHIISTDQATEREIVLALQGGNIETGVIQPLADIARRFPHASIALDFTSCGPRLPLPELWASASFDATSWQGPSGIAFFAVGKQARWTNPLPHVDNTRAPRSYSLPLLLASSVALDAWIQEEISESSRLRLLSARVRKTIADSVSDCDIAGDLDSSMSHKTSISFLYVHGEELLRCLETKGFSVDSGSACTSANLQPSHVLAAMGVLTHGNIRITLHHGVSSEDVEALTQAIIESVAELRSQ
ncbi:unannotated protein [freshwater metagenome]|uniref:Unannotated protein n=1 Tax=freshwater metagenome TaxID=449393 RepID=A0A6J5Z936_9ZZZZ